MSNIISITECPRDAMQGWPRHIPAAEKIAYLNTLLQAGFDVLDFGSFVSPKAIPQMADTAEVLKALNLEETRTKLLAIIANTRGAASAAEYREIAYLGFPFSISETFQQRNTNKSITESLREIEAIQQICVDSNKVLTVYISMGFGNPYGDEYSPEIALEWGKKLAGLGITRIALSDTVGVANPDTIQYLFETMIPALPEVEIGAHFHSHPATWEEKISSAYAAGCRAFDSAIKGIGGCPMAKDDLVGNIATENLLLWCKANNVSNHVNGQVFQQAMSEAVNVFVK